jgi:SHS2 domain-containing protein
MTSRGPEQRRGHRLLPHTADVIVEAWGSDVLACAEEAAQALIDICVSGDPEEAAGTWASTFDVPPVELVRSVLEEVVFALDTSEVAPVSAHLDRSVDSGITLRLGLASPESVRFTGAAPKAIVMMDPEPTGTDLVRCRFIVDV